MRAIVLLLLVFTMSLAALAEQRFDFKVREDMFAGMDGDFIAFDRAMKLIADTLAREPDHAEALVWWGTGRLFMAGQASTRRHRRGREAFRPMDCPTWGAPGRSSPRRYCRAAYPGGPPCCPMRAAQRRFDRSGADRLTRIAIGDFEVALRENERRADRPNEHDRGELRARWLTAGCSSATQQRPTCFSIV